MRITRAHPIVDDDEEHLELDPDCVVRTGCSAKAVSTTSPRGLEVAQMLAELPEGRIKEALTRVGGYGTVADRGTPPYPKAYPPKGEIRVCAVCEA